MAQLMLEGQRLLMSSRLRAIIQTLQTTLDLQAPLIWLKRIPLVDAFDDELFARFQGKIYAADIIMDDQKAVVYKTGQLKLYTTQIPNLKVGAPLSQADLNRMNRLQYGALLPSRVNALEEWEQNLAKILLQGVRHRLHTLSLAMVTDGLSLGVYNRLGVGFDLRGTWGMPANLKVTVAQPWSSDGVTANANATPIADIQTIANEVAADNYGVRFDRATMSSQAFRFMIATPEFAAKAQTIFGFPYTSGGGQGSPLATHDLPRMMQVAGTLLNMEVELEDEAYTVKDPQGNDSRLKFLPQNLVVLTNRAADGDGTVWDIANCPVTESLVAGLVGQAPEGLGGEQHGPVGYYTPAEFDLNQPGVNAWAVARAMPRRYQPEASAVLTVGSFGYTGVIGGPAMT